MSPLLKIALMVIMSSPALAGPNQGATASLDINVRSSSNNQIDDKVTRATVSGFGTEFSVEIFISPITDPIIGGEIVFDLVSGLQFLGHFV